MDVMISQVKAIKIKDEIDGLRILTVETKKGDFFIYLRKADMVKRLSIKRERI